MKNVKNFLLPAVVVIAGISAAFATDASKKADTVLETGYYFNGAAPTIKCISTPVQCNPQGSSICTWTDANNVSHNLQRKVSDAMCGVNLYKPN